MATRISCGGPNHHAVIVDGDKAVGLGGAGDGKDVGAGNLVGRANAIVGSNQGDHRLGRCHGVDHQILRGGCRTDISELVGRLGAKLVGAIRHGRGGCEAPVAIGIRIGGTNKIIISIVDIHLAVGRGGAVHGGGVVVSGCQRGDGWRVGQGGAYL